MNIDRLARFYRWIEYAAYGRALERRRFAFLDCLAEARRVLILGEGDGRALERLVTWAPHARVDVVEQSAKMIALARERVGASERVVFLQQDARAAAWMGVPYDAIVTLFFLDCFDECAVRDLVRQLAASLVPGGIWLVTDFAIPKHGWAHWHARLWIWTMYRFFAVTTGLQVRQLPPIEKLFIEAGLERVRFAEERAGLIRSEVWRKPVL